MLIPYRCISEWVNTRFIYTISKIDMSLSAKNKHIQIGLRDSRCFSGWQIYSNSSKYWCIANSMSRFEDIYLYTYINKIYILGIAHWKWNLFFQLFLKNPFSFYILNWEMFKLKLEKKKTKKKEKKIYAFGK